MGPLFYVLSLQKALAFTPQQAAATALAQLVQGDRAAFADTMAGCYRYILSRVTKFMVESASSKRRPAFDSGKLEISV